MPKRKLFWRSDYDDDIVVVAANDDDDGVYALISMIRNCSGDERGGVAKSGAASMVFQV